MSTRQLKAESWTREHDRILAEKCEGKRIAIIHSGEVIANDDGSYESIDHYNLDITACFRAAEAWRAQEMGRSYKTTSAKTYTIGKRTITHPASAACLQDELYVRGSGEHLHEALYEAVTR